MTGLERDLGDPRPHRPGPDDADRPDRHPGSDELHRFERLATVAAVVERAALRRSERRIHDDANRAAVRAVDVAGGARFGDAGGGEGATTAGRDPIRRPWRVEGDSDVHGTTERFEADCDGVPDEVERRAADERRQQFDA